MAETEKKEPRGRSKYRSEYKPEYAQMLIDHMSQGYSFATFAATIGVPGSTTESWSRNNGNFKRAKEIGSSKAQHKWETIALAAIQGGLKRIKKETLKKSTDLDEKGMPVKDKNGKVSVREEVWEQIYETIPLRDSMWIFTMKAQFGWRDGNNGEPFDDPNAPPKSGNVKRFLLAYNLNDKPYKVLDRPETSDSSPSNEADNSNEQEKEEAGL